MIASQQRFVISGFVISGILGCGDGANYAPVTGKVTLDGKPLAAAYLVFEPESGTPEQASTGKTDSSGRYTLAVVGTQQPGALVGRHRVRLTTVAPDAMQDELSTLPNDRIPARYQRNPLTVEVSADGANEADFDLKS